MSFTAFKNAQEVFWLGETLPFRDSDGHQEKLILGCTHEDYV